MKTSTALGVLAGAVVIVTASILSWFSVSLTFWQNLAIVVLANMIFKNSGSSSK
jgi:predicted permease